MLQNILGLEVSGKGVKYWYSTPKKKHDRLKMTKMYLRFGRQPPLLLHDVSVTLDVLLGHDLLDVVEFVQLHKNKKK